MTIPNPAQHPARRTLAITCSLLALAAGSPNVSAQAPDTAMLLPKTITSSEGDPQKGGVAIVPRTYDKNAPYIIAFWAKRQAADGGTNHHLWGASNTRTANRIGSRDRKKGNANSIPADGQWHYVWAVIGDSDNDGNFEAATFYDGNSLGTVQDIYLDILDIGTRGYDLDASFLEVKEPTSSEMLIDDISIWSGNSPDVIEIHQRISRYGIDELPESHPDLLDYWDCSPGNTLDYQRDGTADYAGLGTFSSLRTTPSLIEVRDKPRRFIRLSITSEFGAENVSPTISESGDFPRGRPVTFNAPQYIYLDRFRRELPGESPEAYYRQEVTRAILSNGKQINADGSGQLTFTETLDDHLEVAWQWKEQVAVFIDPDSRAGVPGRTRLNGGNQDSQTSLDRYWVDVGTTIQPEFTLDNTERFRATGFIVEGHSDSGDRALRFDGAGMKAQLEARLPEPDDFTIEFWAKAEKQDATTESELARVQPGNGSRVYRIGRHPLNHPTNPGGIFFANASTGGILAEIDGTLTGSTWHHWTWVYDHSAQTLESYRNGRLLESFQPIDLKTGDNSPYGRYLVGYSPTTNPFNGTVDTRSVTFEMDVTFEANTSGENELLFEFGGNGSGVSLVYLPTGALVFQTAGSAARIDYPITTDLHGSPTSVTASIRITEGSQDQISLHVGTATNAISEPVNLNGDWTGPDRGTVGIAPTGGATAGFSTGDVSGFSSGTIGSAGLLVVPSDSVVVGNSPSGDRPFKGTINNFRLWSRTLDQAEIRQSMDIGVYGPGQTGLEVELPFDEGLFDTFRSAEGNGYVGTISGASAASLRLVTQFNADFSNNQLPAGARLLGDAELQSDALRLTPDQDDQTGSLVIEDVAAGRPVMALAATFNARIASKTNNNEADGFSFSFGPGEPDSAVGEDGVDPGLVLRVDQWQEAVSLRYGGLEITSRSRPRASLVSLDYVPYSIVLEENGQVTVSRAGEVVFDKVQTDFHLESARGWRTVFGARTGGESTEHWIESISIDYQTINERALYSGFSRTVRADDHQGVSYGTGDLVADDWIRLSWNFEEQFSILLNTIPVGAPYSALPFLAIDGESIDLDWSADGMATVLVGESKHVRVGSRYRDRDGCYTLSELRGQGTLSAASLDLAADGSLGGQVTRELAIERLFASGTLTFTYTPTIYRAEIPLGQALELAAVDATLVPNLCTGGALDGLSGPQLAELNEDGARREDLLQWDPVGRRVFPLRPGILKLNWPDATDPDVMHRIDLVAGWPSETNDFGVDYNRENNDGSRQGEAPDYLDSATFAAIADAYPASPVGHYHYLLESEGGENPPVGLDPNPSDRWFFHRMPFAEPVRGSSEIGTAIANVNNENKTFTSDNEGRAVLLYSYRPDPTDVATGNQNREEYAVRIVSSISGSAQSHTLLSSDNRRTFRSDETAALYLSSEAGEAGYGIGSETHRTLEFWAKLDGDVPGGELDRVALEAGFGAAGETLRIGFRGASATSAPGAFYLESGDTTLLELDELRPGDSWHHWCLVFDATADEQRLYVDGNLAGVSNTRLGFTSSASNNVYTWGYSKQAGGLWLNGELDNLALWDGSATTSQVRAMMRGERFVEGGTSDQTPITLFKLDEDTAANTIPASYPPGATAKLTVYRAPDEPVTDIRQALALQAEDGFNEVATRISSKLDTAGLGTGYVLNDNASNYNPTLYRRTDVFENWGPIFPVNSSAAFPNDDLRVAYYENPYRVLPFEGTGLHPNVAWPTRSIQYGSVSYPENGAHKNKRIFIASRLGTEGVDANGNDQLAFDPARYANLSIYNQPDQDAAGYNPNEEHALLAPSIKAALTGDGSFNLGQNAAFALQTDLNATATTFTSEPWVLVQYQEVDSGEWQMAAYKVEKTRTGGTGGEFPIVILNPDTHLPDPARFNADGDYNYNFDYQIFAGELVTAPYPLNLVIGAALPKDADGKLLATGGNVNTQRTLWLDKNGFPWSVSGGSGRFFYRHWYPLRTDFWFDASADGTNGKPSGTALAWLPEGTGSSGTNDFLAEKTSKQPQAATYTSFWKSNYPKLKRGETLAYAGGEYKAEHPLEDGLPAVVAWASAQLVYDSKFPAMNHRSAADIDTKTSARIVRPLDRHEVHIGPDQMETAGFTPAATDKIMVVAERWYFKQLTGSLQKRLYYDSIRQTLVLRGRLNNLEGGDPDLTDQPVSLSILEPNILSVADYNSCVGTGEGQLGATGDLLEAINTIFDQTQDPQNLDDLAPATAPSPANYYAGFQNAGSTPGATLPQPQFYTETTSGGTSSFSVNSNLTAAIYEPHNSLGVGSALVADPGGLLLPTDTSQYVTLVENNHPAIDGAVTLHVVEIVPQRFRGAIKVIEAQDVFDEKINLAHTADFGGNASNVYYEWWIREVDNLDAIGTPDDGTDSAWTPYTKGLGLNKIEFNSDPATALSDKLFYVRYGEQSEFTDLAAIDASDWQLVELNDADATYSKQNSARVPYQWAGAANSPQPQSDGSKRFIPQLVMGWVKRVLDRVNPYEARYTDFYNNESPAIYSSVQQILGGPYVGNVALNSDKDVLENIGLIQLYETILNRARKLTIDASNPLNDPGTNQALLLAATRLSAFYELLASEAYADAQDPTIRITSEAGQVSDDDEFRLATSYSFAHAFMNQEASILHEELALLRGTDFVKSAPVVNRLMWNYVKGLGEAAYNVNYNIHDTNEDGFLNEFDAAQQYPMGHGDAWGHYLSAGKMHYELLRNDVFAWQAKHEFYSLLDNVIPADYLDEKTFARTAAAKVRAGNQIVQATYRLAYTEDPEAQWQGYTDVDQARAWGVSEWSKRVGQGALFDWAVGNAIVPGNADEAAGGEVENLAKIDRQANQAELGEIAMTMLTVQSTLDQANAGLNPLGMDRDAVVFDIDPVLFNLSEAEPQGHFPQVYSRAHKAIGNAINALGLAVEADLKIRVTADETRELQIDALRQDIDYRNALIEIFGTPYEGTIGPGKLYPEGYAGPDTLLFNYLDRIRVSDLISARATDFFTVSSTGNNLGITDASSVSFQIPSQTAGPGSAGTAISDFVDRTLTDSRDSFLLEVPVVSTTSGYALEAPADDSWGQRAAFGRVQMILNELLQAETALEQSKDEYAVVLRELQNTLDLIVDRVEIQKFINGRRAQTRTDLLSHQRARGIAFGVEKLSETIGNTIEWAAGAAADTVPTGLEDIPGGIARGLIYSAAATPIDVAQVFQIGGEFAGLVAELNTEFDLWSLENEESLAAEAIELRFWVADFSTLVAEEKAKRTEIAVHLQQLVILGEEYQSTLAEGFRLLAEREAFNKVLASAAQRNRYQDMVVRLSRNETLRNYQSAFDNAQRYVWLAAKAYEYETGLAAGDPASVTSLLEEIVRTRSIGLWDENGLGDPRIGHGGLTEVLARLLVNYETLLGQFGINNPQFETGKLSLRHEHFRIGDHRPGNTLDSDKNWRDAIMETRVDNLWEVPAFRDFCRPFASPQDGSQPGLVIPFSTEITPGKNVFGRPLGGEDHAYSTANFATKIRSLGVWFEGYNHTGLSTTPRVYLVPAGADVLRVSNADFPEQRVWNVVEQRIPVPFSLNTSDLANIDFIPSIHSINGSFGQVRRIGDFRAYHDSGDSAVVLEDELVSNTRLITRSVWNTQWYLIIPGATLHADPSFGLDQFIGNTTSPGVSDIKLFFETYGHEGN